MTPFATVLPPPRTPPPDEAPAIVFAGEHEEAARLD
jgi:hypothetical protein